MSLSNDAVKSETCPHRAGTGSPDRVLYTAMFGIFEIYRQVAMVLTFLLPAAIMDLSAARPRSLNSIQASSLSNCFCGPALHSTHRRLCPVLQRIRFQRELGNIAIGMVLAVILLRECGAILDGRWCSVRCSSSTPCSASIFRGFSGGRIRPRHLCILLLGSTRTRRYVNVADVRSTRSLFSAASRWSGRRFLHAAGPCAHEAESRRSGKGSRCGSSSWPLSVQRGRERGDDRIGDHPADEAACFKPHVQPP